MNEKVDIRAIIHKLISKWYYFLFCLAITVPFAYVYVKFADTIYQVRASILLTGQMKNGMGNEKFMKGMELLTSHTELEDEIGILKSFNLVGSTLQKLDFGISYFEKKNFTTHEKYGDGCPFKIELDSSVHQILGVPIYIKRTSPGTYSVFASAKNVSTYNFYTNQMEGVIPSLEIDQTLANEKPFVHKNLSFKIIFDYRYNFDHEKVYFFILQDLGSLTEMYREKLDIKPISRESNIVEINIRGRNPRKDILFLNKLLDVYLANELHKRNQLGIKTIRFIDDQLSGVTNELRQAEGSLESFRSRNNILNINATAENLTKTLDRLETDKSALELKLKYYKYIASALDKADLKNIQTPSTFGLEDPLLNNLLIELERLNQERIGLNYSTKDTNPVVKVLDLKIANHKKALMDNVSNFIQASTNALADLDRKIGEIQRNVNELPRSERELVNIQRKFDFNDNVYNYLLEKRAEAGIAIASNTNEKTIVDKAQQVGWGPVSPNRRLIMIIAVLGGLSLAVGLIILNDLINNNRIVTTEDVEKSTRIPTIGTIVHGAKRDHISGIVANGKSVLAECFRSLRVNLEYLTLGKAKSVIGITSSIMNEGKTFCSSNLALSMAQAGRKTVLIDADMRRPQVARAFNLKNEKGLSNYLIGACSLEEIINETGSKDLDVITSGPIPPNPLDLIGLPKMEELIEDLKQAYDMIIIDTPPVGPVSEYVILMKYTGANICVIRSNYTSRNHLEKINKLYDEKKIKNLSILLNDARMSVNGYAYYDYK
ncbi:MAG: polysaccharide biosynthesis tyrosine autokinase [Bacteroidetes bacterium]|nr:polysaccharide biosynthesis tyrosine autokinase [Bacteroidota bacterium]